MHHAGPKKMHLETQQKSRGVQAICYRSKRLNDYCFVGKGVINLLCSHVILE